MKRKMSKKSYSALDREAGKGEVFQCDPLKLTFNAMIAAILGPQSSRIGNVHKRSAS